MTGYGDRIRRTGRWTGTTTWPGSTSTKGRTSRQTGRVERMVTLMRRRRILVGFAVCLVAAATFGGAMIARSGSSDYSAKPDADTQAQLQATADQLVTANLDPTS